jgi:hypothetical protein
MLDHLPKLKNCADAHSPLVRNLSDLFDQIDVNDDKTLEWVEFTNHIIELGMVRKDSNLVDAIKNYMPSGIKDG